MENSSKIRVQISCKNHCLVQRKTIPKSYAAQFVGDIKSKWFWKDGQSNLFYDVHRNLPLSIYTNSKDWSQEIQFSDLSTSCSVEQTKPTWG